MLLVGSGPVWRGGAGHLVRQGMFLEAWKRVVAEEGGVGAEVVMAMFHVEQDEAAEANAGVFHVEHEDREDRDAGLAPVRVVPLRMPTLRRESRWRQFLTDATHPQPRTFRIRAAEASRQAVAALNPASFDAVFAYRIDFASWAGVLDHPGLLLDVDDPEHVRAARRAASQSEDGAIDWRTRRDLAKLRRLERRAVRGAIAGGGAAFVCQEGDREAFPDAAAGDGLRVVPNSVPVPPMPEVEGHAPPVLMMMGNFAAGPATANHDALMWFADEVWPRIESAKPEARFRVVGRLTADLEAALGDRPGVELAGFAADLDDAFRGVAASVVPIRFGTGTRIKILDAFARGCPVVSTTMGADGLAYEAGRDLLVGDTPAELAEQCLRVLEDTPLRARLAHHGYALVERRYNQARTVQMLTRLLPELAWGRGGRGGRGGVGDGRESG